MADGGGASGPTGPATEAIAWLVGSAAPLWAEVGIDGVRGGFHERIAPDAKALVETRRVRVTARQVYAFATAARVGWSGPVRTLIDHGLDFLRGPGRSPAGRHLIAHRIAPDGRLTDAGPDLYDQAFQVLALAEAYRLLQEPALRAEALALLAEIRTVFGHPSGGFLDRPGNGAILRSNPHMHLLEAAVAWMEVGPAPEWLALGREVTELLTQRFVDPATGALMEYFAADWSPLVGDEGDVVEPGHMFEWSWLLWRWQALTGDDLSGIARTFAALGRSHGIDAARGLAVDELRRDLSVRRASARLWPQTERLKSAIAMRDWGVPGSEAEIEAAWRGLGLYLAPVGAGLWRDRCLPDGTTVDEPSPASTFYHLACAVLEWQRADAASGAPRRGGRVAGQ